MHKGKYQYIGPEISNINMFQSGMYFATPHVGDIHKAGTQGELNIVNVADGPAGNGSDTWISIGYHDFKVLDKIWIKGTTNYNTAVTDGAPNSGVDVTAIESQRIAVGLSYTAETFGTKAQCTISVNDAVSVYNMKDFGSFIFTDVRGNQHIASHNVNGQLNPADGEYLFSAAGDTITATIVSQVFDNKFKGGYFPTASASGNKITLTQPIPGEIGNTSCKSNQSGLTITNFTGGAESTGKVAMYETPHTGSLTGDMFEYPNDEYFIGVMCYPTVDGDQTATNAPLLDVQLTPYDEDLWSVSKAESVSEPRIALQQGQGIYGAFKRVRVRAQKNCRMALIKG
jgi:hypothetical protein